MTADDGCDVPRGPAGATWDRLRALSAGIDTEALTPDELVEFAGRGLTALPEAVVSAVHRYRTGASGADVLVLRGVLPETVDWGPSADGSTAPVDAPEVGAAVLWLLSASLLLGEPFTFRTFCRGRIVQHVVPVPEREHTQTGESSSGTLGWHVEDGFREDRCDHFALLCLRGDPSAATEYAPVRDLDLPGAVVDVLREPRFHMLPDTGHDLEEVRPLRTPVLGGTDGDPTINFDAHYLSPAGDDPVARSALAELTAALDGARRRYVLRRGDLMFLDNRRLVHGRSPFTARYDRADRWLLRTMICGSLPRLRRAGTRVLP